MKKFLKTTLYFLLNLLPSKKEGNQVIILMYHSVSNSKTFFSVSPQVFEKQINYLVSNKYNIVSLDKLVGYFNNQSIPPRTVLITFDDGYEDNYSNVFPIFKKYKVSATIFISTSMVGTEVQAKNGEKFRILDFSQIKEMKKSGLIEFGAHGHNHQKLTSLSESEIEQELLNSKKILEEKLECEIKYFAYPSGKFNDFVKAKAQKYFQLALTVLSGGISPQDDLFALKRNSIDSQVSWSQFKYIIKHGKL